MERYQKWQVKMHVFMQLLDPRVKLLPCGYAKRALSLYLVAAELDGDCHSERSLASQPAPPWCHLENVVTPEVVYPACCAGCAAKLKNRMHIIQLQKPCQHFCTALDKTIKTTALLFKMLFQCRLQHLRKHVQFERVLATAWATPTKFAIARRRWVKSAPRKADLFAVLPPFCNYFCAHFFGAQKYQTMQVDFQNHITQN